VLAVVLLTGSCSVLDSARTPNIEEVEPAKYEIEFLRCSVETDEEYAASQAEPSIGGDTSRDVVAEYRITNLDDIRRRFNIRGMLSDSNGNNDPFVPKDTDRLDPGESSVEQIRLPVTDPDDAPYSCDAEVWDSVIDDAFPDD